MRPIGRKKKVLCTRSVRAQTNRRGCNPRLAKGITPVWQNHRLTNERRVRRARGCTPARGFRRLVRAQTNRRGCNPRLAKTQQTAQKGGLLVFPGDLRHTTTVRSSVKLDRKRVGLEVLCGKCASLLDCCTTGVRSLVVHTVQLNSVESSRYWVKLDRKGEGLCLTLVHDEA